MMCGMAVGKYISYNREETYYQEPNMVWLGNSNLEIHNDFYAKFYKDLNGKLNSITFTQIYGLDLRSLKIEYPVSEVNQKKSLAI